MAAALSLFTFSTTASAQLGSLSADLVFTPVTPCRIVDTRNAGAGGPITGGTSRAFIGWGNNYTAQGGSATNCGLPFTTNIAAISINLVAVSPAGDGYLTAWPVGTTQPTASNLNYVTGNVLANSAILKISQAGGATDWNLYTQATTHVVADVTGYYAKPVATALDCVDVASTGAVTLPASGTATISSGACAATHTITGGSCVGFSFNANVVTSRTLGSTYFCAYQNSSATATTVDAIARCCRVPGR